MQTQIMKEYPAELTVVFFYNLIVSILAAIVGAFTQPDSSSWKLKPDIALASILCSVSTTYDQCSWFYDRFYRYLKKFLIGF